MKAGIVFPVWAAFCVLLLSSSVDAHIAFIEPETREAEPASLSAGERAELDYSFDRSFPLAEDVSFQDLHDFAFDGIDSMAISAYLVPGDLDVYRVVPADNPGFIFPAIMASVLTPACAELEDAYPVLALVGPGLPREPDVLALLPFDIDDGAQVPQPAEGQNGALYAPNPAQDRRALFIEPDVTGLSWFLPKGLTQECLFSSMPIIECETFENTIVAVEQDGMVVGQPYYVAVWDPTDRAQDYTMNLGMTDDHYVERADLNAEIECFSMVHGGCSQPYPDEPAPEGYFSPLCEEVEEKKGSSGCAAAPVRGHGATFCWLTGLLGLLLYRGRFRA